MIRPRQSAAEITSNLSRLIRPRFHSLQKSLNYPQMEPNSFFLTLQNQGPIEGADPAVEMQKPAESRVEDRYGDAGKAGWSPIPDVLLFNQHKLKIAGDDLIVLLNLMAHYYVKNEMPFIRPTTIAKRMGVSQRTVQRSITRLRKAGLILKAKHKENGHIIHDLSPLIARLQPLGEERIADRKARHEHQRSVAQLDRATSIERRP